MVVRFRQHASDDAALLGNPEALFGAERLDIDSTMHCGDASPKAAPPQSAFG
jgi:hypothetical protein